MNIKQWLLDHTLTFTALLLITLVGLAAAKWTGIQSVYPTLVMGILSVCGIHKGAESLSDFVAGKVAQPAQDKDTNDKS